MGGGGGVLKDNMNFHDSLADYETDHEVSCNRHI